MDGEAAWLGERHLSVESPFEFLGCMVVSDVSG